MSSRQFAFAPQCSWEPDNFALHVAAELWIGTQAYCVMWTEVHYVSQMKMHQSIAQSFWMDKCGSEADFSSAIPPSWLATSSMGQALLSCRSPSQREQERAGFQTVDGCDWWDYVIPLLKTQQGGYGATYHAGLSMNQSSNLSGVTDDFYGSTGLPQHIHGKLCQPLLVELLVIWSLTCEFSSA